MFTVNWKLNFNLILELGLKVSAESGLSPFYWLEERSKTTKT